MIAAGYRLRGLSFVGPGAEPAGLDFKDGLNVVYGASNTGKSFIAKTLDFMLGGSRPLPGVQEAAPYVAVLLKLLMPDGRPVTLYRARAGGPFLAFDGLHDVRPAEPGVQLKDAHDPRAVDNLSMFLLNAIGLGARPLVKNAKFGEKETLSIRRLAPYVIVDENAIIGEGSPVLSGQYTGATVEKNVLKLLLTGRDDEEVVTLVKPELRQARVGGQIELLDEMIARVDAELGDSAPSRTELADQALRLDATLSEHKAHLQNRQDRIDELVRERRDVFDRLDVDGAREAEIQVTLARFQDLDDVYAVDVHRLEALEEGGSLLLAISGRPCPLCQADPEHQRHRHSAEEVRSTREAAAAEIAKIRRERRDLALTMTALRADASGLRRLYERLLSRSGELDRELAELRPREAELKAEYERLLVAREAVRLALNLHAERDRLVVRRSLLDAEPAKAVSNGKVVVGIDGFTAHRFSQTVEQVLTEWRFPGSPTVNFDAKTYDIQIDGKDRAANGKGVRAILHAAFKIAVLIYCRDNGLPHPGFVALDTPLLTYREPMQNPRHGDLSADEEELKSTKLDEHFYRHLGALREYGQIIVLENADPPAGVLESANVTVFTGRRGDGRFGLFPRAQPSVP